MRRILMLLLSLHCAIALSACGSVPSDMPEAKELLLNSWDLLDYDLHLIANAEVSGKGLWCDPCLARDVDELKDDYHYTFCSWERNDVRGTNIVFTDYEHHIRNTLVVHKSTRSAKQAFTDAKPYFLHTFKNWDIAPISDESKAWQSNVYNVNKGREFEVLVCFRKGVVLVSLWVFADTSQPCPEEIERFVLELARRVEAKIP